jgi:hypothetical protein
MSIAAAHSVASTAELPRPPRDPRTFWRVALAVIAPIPPIAIAISDLLAPDKANDTDKESLHAIAAHTGQVAVGLWFSAVFLLGLLPAVVAVLWACRRHAPRFTAVVGGITVLGICAGLSIPAYNLNDYVAAKKGIDPNAVLALNKGLENQPTVIVTTLLFLLGMILFGRILLGVLLWRSRIAPRWMSVALMLAGPVDVFGPNELVVRNGAGALSWLLTAVGFAAASLALLRTRNDDFDLPAAVTS